MYQTEKLNQIIDDYLHNNKNPTRKGLAQWLHISTSTINRVICGCYNGKIYGIVPHCTRCIANKDFALIRSVFKAGKE